MKRYKLRKETEGAFVFDSKDRNVFALTEAQTTTLLSSTAEYSPEIEGRDFFMDGKANFTVVDPFTKIGSETESCFLSAPNRLYLEITRACNLRCRMCYNAGGKSLPGEFSLAEWKFTLDQMEQAGVFEARLTGGEPTIRPEFLEILDHAIAKGFYVSLATSGVWDEALTREVCNRKIDDVIVSLDGPAEINDRFRLGGSYIQTFNTILALKNAGIRKVRINTVLSSFNWRHLEPLVALCKEYDLLLIDFIHPRPFGRGESERSSMLSSEETYQFNVLVKGWREKYPGVNIIMDFDLLADKEPMRHPIVPRIHSCPAGREFAFISPQGYMFPCGVSPVHDISQMTEQEKQFFIAGNLHQTPLLEIWRRSPVWTAFRDLRQCKPQKCFRCRFWGKKCFGTCPIGAYYESGRLNGEDPYCYVNCLPEVHS